jgi:hypothetical protein
LTYEANQDDLYEYGRSTNPNLKLRRIQDVHVSGIGAQLVVSGGTGGVRAGRERVESVRVSGTGAVLRPLPSLGRVFTAQYVAIHQGGEGARLELVAGCGAAAAGVTPKGSGISLKIVGGAGSQRTGVSVSGGGKQISVTAGVLDDVFAVRNPTDEELAVIAYQLYKLVA